MKLAIGLGGEIAEIGPAARRAEAAGFESAWVAELEHSGYAQAALALAATERMGVGTAIALAFPRSPTITAMEAADLAASSGGRFLLGLGSQVRRIVEERFGVPFDRPAARMEDYVRAVRAVWAGGRGEAARHDGPFYRISRLTFGRAKERGASAGHELAAGAGSSAGAGSFPAGEPPHRDPPILVAAVGPLMSRIAGRVADGLIGHPLASPAWLRETVEPAVAAGLAEAGRPADACPITASPLVAIATDADQARRAARLQLAFYATTPNYRGILALHDREPVVGEVRRAFVRGDRERMISAIDDDLLDSIAIAGRPDEARDRLAAWRAVADRAILAPPWYGAEPGFAQELWDAIADAFGGGAGRE